MKRILGVLVFLALLSSSVFAADLVCPELTAVQRWAGYLSWMGFLKVCAVVALSTGFCIFFFGFFEWAWDFIWTAIRGIADILAFALSGALIVWGASVSDVYRLWPVLGGCILLGASLMFCIWLREIKINDPSAIFGILAVIWGFVALHYNMSEIGFLAVAAFMGVLGFSVAVTPFCYAFGFRREKDIVSATTAALLMLVIYGVEHIWFRSLDYYLNVFEAGAFWLGSFVGFLGLLIVSSKWYVSEKHANYVWIQILTIVFYMTGVEVGMTYGINPLAGMGGTFLVFYAAAKLCEVETESAMGFGVKLMLIGGVFTGAWQYAQNHLEEIKVYLTTTLPQ